MKVKFISLASEEQVNWGGNDNPNKVLSLDKEYEVLRKEVHSWHTKLILKDFPDKKFNSVNFLILKEENIEKEYIKKKFNLDTMESNLRKDKDFRIKDLIENPKRYRKDRLSE